MDQLRGMGGILQFQEHSGDITAPYDREAVVWAFHWLKSNNPLYQQFRDIVLLLSHNNSEWRWESPSNEK